MNFNRLCVIFLLLLLVGCASKIPTTRIIERNGIAAFVSTDDHRVAYIKNHGNLDRVCASRESDAVATDETAVSFGLSSVTGQSEQVGEQSGRGELSLGGRSPLVLMSREFLYRACELSNNLNLDPQTTIAIYKMFLNSLEHLAVASSQTGTASVSSSLPSYQVTTSVPPHNAEEDDSSSNNVDSDDSGNSDDNNSHDE